MRSDEIVYAIHAPIPSDPNHFAEAFKQSPRREDDIAIVTSGLFFFPSVFFFFFSISFTNLQLFFFSIAMSVKLHPETNVVEDIKLVFGGMGPRTLSATETEKKLVGKRWGDEDTLEQGIQGLGEEMKLEVFFFFFSFFLSKI